MHHEVIHEALSNIDILSLHRVMTVSFHKYGDMFFPGTGDVKVTFILACFINEMF